MHSQTLFFRLQSPLHSGSGRELSFIDNPIQRERLTKLPIILSSSIRGALRAVLTEKAKEKSLLSKKIEQCFGTDSQKGAMAISDAQIILYPLKSNEGIFMWGTCPFLLRKFYDLQQIENLEDFKKAKDFTSSTSKTIFLEKCGFTLDNCEIAKRIEDTLIKSLANKHIKNRLVILSDTAFCNLLYISRQIVTRNKINVVTGTVAGKDNKGNLFSEEYVPAQTIFYSQAIFAHGHEIIHQSILQLLDEIKAFFLGGNTSIGKGLTHLKVGMNNEN